MITLILILFSYPSAIFVSCCNKYSVKEEYVILDTTLQNFIVDITDVDSNSVYTFVVNICSDNLDDNIVE